MKKWLWRILLVVDCCLLLIVAVLWVRSATRFEGVSWVDVRPGGERGALVELSLDSVGGRIWINLGKTRLSMWTAHGEPFHTGCKWRSQEWIASNHDDYLDIVQGHAGEGGWHALGFHAGYFYRHHYVAREDWLIATPHWFLIALFSVPLLIECRRWYIGRGRYKTGLCQSCGYDLRASVDRCPECGMAIELAGAAAGAENPSST